MTRTNARPFLDTNILIYALAANDRRSLKAEALIAAGGVVSVQVLNEYVSVSRRKLGRAWHEIEQSLAALELLLGPAIPLTLQMHHSAIEIARDHNVAFYDALILAAAASAACAVLYTEDLQDGRKIAGVEIRNPFAEH
jgi:predicted nucleic acid-binding protein